MHHPCMLSIRQFSYGSTRSSWLRHWLNPLSVRSTQKRRVPLGSDAPLCSLTTFGCPRRQCAGASQLLAKRVAAATRATRSSAYRGRAHARTPVNRAQTQPGLAWEELAPRRHTALTQGAATRHVPPRLMNSASRLTLGLHPTSSRALSAGTSSAPHARQVGQFGILARAPPRSHPGCTGSEPAPAPAAGRGQRSESCHTGAERPTHPRRRSRRPGLTFPVDCGASR